MGTEFWASCALLGETLARCAPYTRCSNPKNILISHCRNIRARYTLHGALTVKLRILRALRSRLGTSLVTKAVPKIPYFPRRHGGTPGVAGLCVKVKPPRSAARCAAGATRDQQRVGVRSPVSRPSGSVPGGRLRRAPLGGQALRSAGAGCCIRCLRQGAAAARPPIPQQHTAQRADLAPLPDHGPQVCAAPQQAPPARPHSGGRRRAAFLAATAAW